MKVMIGYKDRKGQIWEWLAEPAERYYVLASRMEPHPSDGIPCCVHDLLSLNSGIVVESYIEHTMFEELMLSEDPEVRRLL